MFKKKSILSVIEWTNDNNEYNPNWLIYRYPETQFNSGSKLIVNPGQVAIVVYNGQVKEIIQPGTHELSTNYFPFLNTIQTILYGKKPAYPISIYFINTVLKLDILWGTQSPLEIRDPVYGIILRIRSRGQLGLKLEDYQFFYEKLVGSFATYNVIEYNFVSSQFKGWINQNIKTIIAQFLEENKISYDQINVNLHKIQEKIKEAMDPEVQSFGFKLVRFAIDSISIPDEDKEKINRILEKKSELSLLGEDYKKVKGYDVLSSMAQNTGTTGTIFATGNIMGSGSGNFVDSLVNDKNNQATNNTLKACLKCNWNNDSNSKFCSNCGNLMKKICANCNIEVIGRFCSNCGKGME